MSLYEVKNITYIFWGIILSLVYLVWPINPLSSVQHILVTIFTSLNFYPSRYLDSKSILDFNE